MTLDANTASHIHASWSWIAIHHDHNRMRDQLEHLTPAELDEVGLAACIMLAAAAEITEAKAAEHVHHYNSRGLCVCDIAPVPDGVDGSHIGTRVWP